MAILRIVTYPDPFLTRKSSPVTTIDESLKKLMNDMVETMYHEGGVGLAAVQVGILKKVFVIDISDTKDQPLYFINPQISFSSTSKSLMKEGCLSFPGVNSPSQVERFTELEVSYMDENGMPQTMKATGFLAQAIQHEYDHLEGKVYTDHLAEVEGLLIKQKVIKAIKKLKD
jgi:peptide deformylase